MRVPLLGVVLFAAIALAAAADANQGDSLMVEYLKCHVCETPKLTGEIDDCCCSSETVDGINSDHFLPLLTNLTARPYFKFFQVDLWKGCHLWQADGMCMSPNCAVCECDPEELPEAWRAEKGQPCDDDRLGKVTFSDEWSVGTHFNAWDLQRDADAGSDDDLEWTVSDLDGEPKYINLLENPERYTGYAGPDANKIWTAIKEENCFEDSESGECLEERVFARVVSGLQASISSHLSTKFLFEDGTWGPNVELYVQKLGRHEPWLRNMHFLFVFMVRALAKAMPILREYDLTTGNLHDDAVTKALLLKLADVDAPSVLAGFDESRMFKVRSEELLSECPSTLQGLSDLEELKTRFLNKQFKMDELKHSFRSKFRNVSRILDCVTCEKCRLWGKLQFLGVGTALKILFAKEDSHGVPQVTLSKNEIVALVNSIHQVSRSVHDVGRMRDLEASHALEFYASIALAVVVVGLVGCICLQWRRSRTTQSKSKDQ